MLFSLFDKEAPKVKTINACVTISQTFRTHGGKNSVTQLKSCQQGSRKSGKAKLYVHLSQAIRFDLEVHKGYRFVYFFHMRRELYHVT